MESIYEMIQMITPPDEAARAAAKTRWDSLAKPLGSLGLLEDAITKIAALRGNADAHLSDRRLLVFCADNGVVAQGVTQCGSEVTAKVAQALAEGHSSVSPIARAAKCSVTPVDVGILDFPGHPGVLDRCIRNGTADISLGPAMQRGECLAAMDAGAALARQCAEAGADVLLTGEMGIGNTTTAAAVVSVLLGLDPDTVTGRGAGLSDEGLSRKRAVIKQAIAVNRPDPDDPVDVLTKVGGLDLAAMCGAYLGAAASRVPAVIDGFISAAAALCALRMCPEAGKAMLASQVSSEPAAKMVLDALEKEPLITAGLHLGEGTGAVLAMPMLDMALAVYRECETFEEGGVEAYRPL